MTSANVTRKALTLGSRDTYTGWCAKNYTETTIPMVIRPSGSSFMISGFGYYAKYPHTGFTTYIVYTDDLIEDAWGYNYRVDTVEFENLLDQFSHRTIKLTKLQDYEARAATSGTWHLDSDSVTTDIRSRTKTWLDTYISAGQIKKDNGSTYANFAIMFAHPDYGLRREFIEKKHGRSSLR